MMTRHAQVRAQQRAISPFAIDILLDFGTPSPAGDGTERLAFDKKAWKRFESYAGVDARRYSDLRNRYLIVADGVVVTTAPRTKRFRRR
jgi:hypothetical protein